jgi:hypothetical protein
MNLVKKGEEFSKLRGVVSVSVVTGRFDLILIVLLKEGFGLLEFYTEEVAQLERQLNPEGHPSFSGCALTGEGVYETLHQISRMIYRRLTAEEGASPAPSADAIDENSLFGEDIAERLMDIDEVDPTWEESIRVDPLAAVPSSTPKDGALLNTILGSLGGASEATVEDAPAELRIGIVQQLEPLVLEALDVRQRNLVQVAPDRGPDTFGGRKFISWNRILTVREGAPEEFQIGGRLGHGVTPLERRQRRRSSIPR